ncbi:hypothetical protein CPEBRM1_ABPJDJAI_01254 [Companilactobacillus paralimentarius]|uniref:glycosyl hydrolase family 8 n=1 Tax=Companilactobacillus paralimentarius TaxID=83526 RepID=UPI00384F9EE6
MKKHKYQWLLSGLIILVAFAIGTAIYNTQSPQSTSNVSTTTIKSRYLTWKKAYLKGSGQQRYVKTNTGSRAQTLSEAQGYGMLITVMAAKQGFGNQKSFDQLTRYYLSHRISTNNPLMSWRQNQKNSRMISTKAEQTSATDGDLDIAYALILADEMWGSKGNLKYNQLADQLLSAIKEYEINPSQTSKGIAQKMCDFFASKKKITAVYTLNGKAVENYTNIAFTAPVAYAAQVLSDQKLKHNYTKDLTAEIPANNYYPATIQMMMLLTSGSIGQNK